MQKNPVRIGERRERQAPLDRLGPCQVSVRLAAPVGTSLNYPHHRISRIPSTRTCREQAEAPPHEPTPLQLHPQRIRWSVVYAIRSACRICWSRSATRWALRGTRRNGRKESLARKMDELGIAMPFVDLTIQVCWAMSRLCDGGLNLFRLIFLRTVHRSVGAPEDGRRRLGGSLLRRGDRW